MTKPPSFEPWPDGPYCVVDANKVAALTSEGWAVVDHWDADRLKVETDEYALRQNNEYGGGCCYYPIHESDIPTSWRVRQFLLCKPRNKQLEEMQASVERRVTEACDAVAKSWEQELETHKEAAAKDLAQQCDEAHHYKKLWDEASKAANERLAALRKYEDDMAKLRKHLGEKAIKEALEAE